jgi:hypothetical protein
MPKVRTLSRTFMKGHIRAGEPTYFVEKAFNSIGYSNIKYLKEMNPKTDLKVLQSVCEQFNESITETKPHTIRMGRHFKANDELTLAVWSGKPYRSKQVKLWTGPIRAVDIVIQINRLYNSMKVCKVVRFSNGPGIHITLDSINKVELAKNDGLSLQDFEAWFNLPFGDHEAQILIWNPEIYY